MVMFNLCKGFDFTDILQKQIKFVFVCQMSACSVDMFVYISIPNSSCPCLLKSQHSFVSKGYSLPANIVLNK
jgi:hypothetical protein